MAETCYSVIVTSSLLWEVVHFSEMLFWLLQKDPNMEAELQYDEFGFRIDSEG